jgi:hypothetical protein
MRLQHASQAMTAWNEFSREDNPEVMALLDAGDVQGAATLFLDQLDRRRD